MKYLVVLSALLGLSASNLRAADAKSDSSPKTNAPVNITATEAKKHVGEDAVVTGTIAEVNKSASLVRLNFDKPYPDNVFTGVIFSRNTNDFPEVEKLKGKTVELSGKIAEYRNRPQIVINSTNQVKVIEKETK